MHPIQLLVQRARPSGYHQTQIFKSWCIRGRTLISMMFTWYQINSQQTPLTSPPYNSSRSCSSDWSHQFFLVTSFYDKTSLSIVQQDGTAVELKLPTFGTYAQKTTNNDDTLGSGTQINSNKPINVISGNLCVFNGAVGDSGSRSYASGIPGSESVGRQYIVPRITNEDANPPGFSVGVVAMEDGTIVDSDGVIRSLDKGETAMFEYSLTDRSVFVNCTKKMSYHTICETN